MALTDQSDVVQLQTFFEKLYRDQSGYVYLAYKTLANGPVQNVEWQQEFYRWPTEKSLILARIKKEQDTKEVYFGVALYKEKSAKKVDIHGSYVLWTEFDGTLPSDKLLAESNIPEPSIRIQSSNEGHEHWYWFTDRFLSVPEIELANRRIAYHLGADASAWDATQVLRPPGTQNHKRSGAVQLLLLSETIHVYNFSESLDDAPAIIDISTPNEIPAVDEVVAKVQIPAKLYLLFKNGVPEGSRSEGLMALCYGFAELRPVLTNEDLLALMLNADSRWGKFSGRSDQVKRLLDIISKVRVKYPYIEDTEQEENKYQKYGFTSLLSVETQIDWVWDGLLHRKGYMLLTGAPGVGKSQMSLNFAANACLGKDFLGRSINEPRKIGFMSMEMGLEELQHFVRIQTAGYTKEELSLLEDNLLLFPMGEPLYLNEGNDKNRKWIEEVIGDESLDGVILDSLGSTTSDELVSEKVRGVMDWNDSLRQKFNCFTWWIHHHRKATGDNKRPNKLSDVYGSMYITARASSVLCLWEINQALQLIPLKVRLSKKPDTINLTRDNNLHYTVNGSGIVVVNTSDGSKIHLPESLDPLPVEQKPGFSLGFS